MSQRLSQPIATYVTALAMLIASATSMTACSEDASSPGVSSELTIARFEAEPARIKVGEAAQLTWEVSEATHVTVRRDDGLLEETFRDGAAIRSGGLEVRPVTTTTYVLEAIGEEGLKAESSVTVEVSARPQRPALTLSIDAPAVRLGERIQLTWVATHVDTISLTANAKPIDLSGSVVEGDTLRLAPTEDTTYVMVGTGQGGQTTERVSVTIETPPTIVSFDASDATLVAGEGTQLIWQTEGATSITLSDGEKSLNVEGRDPVGDSLEVIPAETTRYILTAENSDGKTERSLTVEVTPLPTIVRFVAEPTEVSQGERPTVSWEVEDAATLALFVNDDPIDLGDHELTDSFTLEPLTADAVLRLEATGANRTVSAEVVVEVFDGVRVDTFAASPEFLGLGERTTLRWETTGARAVTLHANGVLVEELAPEDVDGELVAHPTVNTIYTLQAIGAGGETSATLTVTVDEDPRILSFEVAPEAIALGASATLSYQTVNVDSIEIIAAPGGPIDTSELSPRGDTLTLSPQESTIYTLRATGDRGTVEETTMLIVHRGVAITRFDASTTILDPGDGLTLSWTSINAAALTLEWDEERVEVEPEDSLELEDLTQTTTFTLIAEGIGGPIEASITVEVGVRPRVELFEATPVLATAEIPRRLRWRVEGANTLKLYARPAQGEPSDEVRLGDISADMLRRGERTLLPEGDTVYRLVAENNSGEADSSITLRVANRPYIEFFTATPSIIVVGEQVIFDWSVTGAEQATLLWEDELDESWSILIDQADLAEPTSPQRYAVSPSATTTYTLRVESEGIVEPVEAQVTVTVKERIEIVAFGADDDAIAIGTGATTLWWDIEGASPLMLTLVGYDDLGQVVFETIVDSFEGSVEISGLSTPTTFVLQGAGDAAELTVGLVGANLDALRLTEVGADGPGWLELYNTGDAPISLWDVELGTGESAFDDALAPLRGIVPARGCVALALSPNAGADGHIDFATAAPIDLPRPGDDGGAVGIALFEAAHDGANEGRLPLQGVVYGRQLDADDAFIGPLGVEAELDVWLPEGVEGSRSLMFLPRVEGTGNLATASWLINDNPAPGRCFGLVPDPGFDAERAAPPRNPQLIEGRASGPEAGGNELALAGWFPDGEVSVWFDDREAACGRDAFTLACAVPEGAGTVDLILRHPDGDIVYPDWYAFEDIRACAIDAPLLVSSEFSDEDGAVMAMPGDMLLFEGSVYVGGELQPALEGQWGYGPFGTDPDYADVAWTWREADYVGDGDEQKLYATLAPVPEGLLHHVYRFRTSPTGNWTYCDGDVTDNVGVPPSNLFSIDASGVIDTAP